LSYDLRLVRDVLHIFVQAALLAPTDIHQQYAQVTTSNGDAGKPATTGSGSAANVLLEIRVP
jgi:hypothetical protein